MEAGIYKGSVSTTGGVGRLVTPNTNINADPSGYLFGRSVVFTGALMSMTRQSAWEEVARAGGIPEPNTTKRTNVLVLGDFNPANLRPGASYSGKARKAFELQNEGQDIELMTEDDFLRVIEGRYLFRQ
jgi:NAD-dependent DNA ligase